MSKTIFITGASTGIGRATAQLFQERGWNVVATMRSPDQAGDWVKMDHVLRLRLDVTESETIRDAVEKALAHFGAVDVLVNNAGYGTVGPFEASTSVQVERQFATNVTGLMNVTRRSCLTFAVAARAWSSTLRPWVGKSRFLSTASITPPSGPWRGSPRHSITSCRPWVSA